MNKRVVILSIIALALLCVYSVDLSATNNNAPNYLQILTGSIEQQQKAQLQQLFYEYKNLLKENSELNINSQFVDRQKKSFYIIDNAIIAKVQSDIRSIFSQAKLQLSLGVSSQKKPLKDRHFLKCIDIRVKTNNLTIEDIANLLGLIDKKRPYLFLHSIDISNSRHPYGRVKFQAIIRAYAIGEKYE